MSINDSAKEIITLVSRFENESNPAKKAKILESIGDVSNKIKEEISSDKSPTYYENVMQNIPPSKKVDLTKKTVKKAPKKQVKRKKQKVLTANKRKELLRDINVEEDDLKRVYKTKKKKHQENYDFTVYVPNTYGTLSNKFFGELTDRLLKKKSPLVKHLSDSVRISGMNILSKTYVSTAFFSTFFGAIILAVLAVLLTAAAGLQIPIVILSGLFTLLAGAALIFGIMYAYPASEAAKKSKAINNDLPFAIIHMAAVAGSGAQPIAIFKLLLKSEEYKGLESEIKKIVNFVNLFGYDLSTALKNVSLRTPSKRLKELLTGIAATIESGGSLKSYLGSVADDSMNTYRLERKKYVESLSTYSDIYTGVLIAAPLLLMVTLAIINMMGGKIAGLSVASIAWFGTLAALPVINILFYLFLNITQPED